MELHPLAVVVIIAVGIWLFIRAKKLGYLGKSNASPAPAPATPSSGAYVGRFTGKIDMPPHEERIAARNEGLRRKGLPLTGNDEVDNRAQGGGDPDGGMFLTGDFDFTTDANRNVTGEVRIFGHPFALTGQVQPDGNFTLNYLVPLFVGRVNPNNTVTGKLMHGGGEEFVYGYINGTFTPAGA